MDARDVSRTYLTLHEFASATGLSESTVRRRVRDGSLRFVQPGGPGTRILFRVDALERSPDPRSAFDRPALNPPLATRSIDPVQNQPSGPVPRWFRKLPNKKS